MTQSILGSTKRNLGIDESYTVFDQTILTHINSVFADLHQLGIGPTEGFYIEDDESSWSEFTEENPLLNSVKTYMYLRVRLLFDPPTTSFAIDAMKEQIREWEWRLNVYREGEQWTQNQ